MTCGAVAVALVPSLHNVDQGVHLIGDDICFLRQLNVLLRKLLYRRFGAIHAIVHQTRAVSRWRWLLAS